MAGINDFAELCRLAYVPSEEYSDSLFITVNAGLCNLFMEQQALTPDPSIKNAYTAYREMCQANLETGLANMPLIMSPKLDNVQALVLGVCPLSVHQPIRSPCSLANLIRHRMLLTFRDPQSPGISFPMPSCWPKRVDGIALIVSRLSRGRRPKSRQSYFGAHMSSRRGCP